MDSSIIKNGNNAAVESKKPKPPSTSKAVTPPADNVETPKPPQRIRLKDERPGGFVNRIGKRCVSGEVVETDAATAEWLVEHGEFTRVPDSTPIGVPEEKPKSQNGKTSK